MIDCKLLEKKWLYRKFLLTIDGRSYYIEYHGRGAGYEYVALDGNAVAGGTSQPWFIPSFSFDIEEHKIVVNVRVWPWLTIRSLKIAVNGIEVFTI
ncbi:hypothetical protein GPS49_05400 [Acinetobacter haemolyticus]|nr:hypothetical protein [Acinetobacter haemolyticus]